MSRKRALWLLIIILIAGIYFVCTAGPWKRSAGDSGDKKVPAGESIPEEGFEVERLSIGEIKLEYLGHAAFLLEVNDFRVLMDPYSPQVGYGTLEVEADLVTVSHEHLDHNYTAAAPAARVIRGLTSDGLGWDDISFSEGNIHISGLATYHDEASGKLRGRNTVFIFDLGDIRLVHLGDLGHVLGEMEAEKLAPVDVLLIPVGGHYTIDAAEAKTVVEQLSPSVVIPMHYQTAITQNWPIETAKAFLEGEEVIEKGAKPVLITRETLPEKREVWVLERKE